MTYRSLLVLLDQGPLCAARSQAAIRPARVLDCHLVGVAPTGLIDLPTSAHAAASRHARCSDLTLLTQADAIADKTLRPRLDSLHRWLMWQGVSADVRIETTGIGIAQAMLSRAADLDTDLIVMGAYGYARWTERVLGGATRGVLQSMTVPVLMSH